MTITALPALNRTASTFRDDVDTFFGIQLPVFSVETEAARVEINENTLTATTQAQLATTQAQLATTQATAAAASALSAGATIWVSGTTYTAGVSKYSPLDGQVYRRMITGAGTTDPSLDAVNWRVVNGLTSELIVLPFNNLPSMRPSLNLDFANNQAVDPRITFTRASVATRTNNKGLIEIVASGVPRIDYDAVTGACKGLLIEESRTNLLTYSEQFDNAAWLKVNTSVTPNAGIAPDGTLTADSLGKSAAFGQVYLQPSGATLVAHTGSVFLKAGTETSAGFVLTETFGSTILARGNINLLTGEVTGVVGIAPTAEILPGGWWRVRSTVTYTNTNVRLNVYPGTVAGTETGTVLVWGAQLEVGAFPTSYIPTVASQVTRAADVASMTGSNFSSWFRADEGSFVVETKIPNPVSSTVLAVDNGTTSEEIRVISISTGTNPGIYATTGGSTTVASGSTLPVNTPFKATASYAANNSVIAVNGVLGTVDTVGLLPSVNQLRFGSRASGSYLNGHIVNLSYYPKRLTNAELQALSTQ